MFIKRPDSESVIEWHNPGPDDIIRRYPNEVIKWNTTIIVREYEQVLFMRDGKLYDIFSAGRHLLVPERLPLLTKAYNLLSGRKSPDFTATLIFISKKYFKGKWGIRTMVNPTPDMHAPIPLMASGEYQFRITNPLAFIVNVVGGVGSYMPEQINDHLRGFFNENLMQEISKYNFMQVYQNLNETSAQAHKNIRSSFTELGIDLSSIKIATAKTDKENEQMIRDLGLFTTEHGKALHQYKLQQQMIQAGMNPLEKQQTVSQQHQQSITPQPPTGQGAINIKIGSDAITHSTEVKDSVIHKSKIGDSGDEKETERFNICPFCGKDLNFPKTPRFCPFCREKLVF